MLHFPLPKSRIRRLRKPYSTVARTMDGNVFSPSGVAEKPTFAIPPPPHPLPAQCTVAFQNTSAVVIWPRNRVSKEVIRKVVQRVPATNERRQSKTAAVRENRKYRVRADGRFRLRKAASEPRSLSSSSSVVLEDYGENADES